MILPRQARDKHRENSKKTVFPQLILSYNTSLLKDDTVLFKGYNKSTSSALFNVFVVDLTSLLYFRSFVRALPVQCCCQTVLSNRMWG